MPLDGGMCNGAAQLDPSIVHYHMLGVYGQLRSLGLLLT